MKLIMIDNAGCLEDLRVPPANRLEKLDGDITTIKPYAAAAM